MAKVNYYLLKNGIIKRKQNTIWFYYKEDEKLQRNLKRSVSYQRLIRLECYKLIKHFIGMKKYEPFRIWW